MPKPNFSGRWRFNPARSVLEISPPDSTLFVIDHREPDLRLSRTHVIGDRSDTFTLDLTTDGREVVLEHGEVRLRGRAYWDDEVLVFDTIVVRGGVEGSNIVRYTLAPDMDSFVADERYRSASLNYHNTWVMDRE